MGFNVELALTLAHCAVCSVITCWRGSSAWEAHRAASAQQLKSAWIMEQCQNRTFYDNMRRVSTVCDDVVTLGAPSDRALEAFFQYEPSMPRASFHSPSCCVGIIFII